MVYGKFLRANESIGKVAGLTAMSDLGASVLASLFIVPSVLLFSLPLDSGPLLLFDTLPRLFALMGGARITAPLDFVFGSGSPVLGCLFAWVRWGIPAALAVILIGTIYTAIV